MSSTPEQIVVSNTSPLLYLHQVGHIDISESCTVGYESHLPSERSFRLERSEAYPCRT